MCALGRQWANGSMGLQDQLIAEIHASSLEL